MGGEGSSIGEGSGGWCIMRRDGEEERRGRLRGGGRKYGHCERGVGETGGDSSCSGEGGEWCKISGGEGSGDVGGDGGSSCGDSGGSVAWKCC